MAFSPQFLDEVRARVPIADVVGRRVKLVRRGREHTGLCPFHNEKTPSFTVSEQKGFFHCFGCGAHGDVIGFVMRAEGLPFPEAVERLAGEAGLEVPQATPAERARARKAKGLLEVVEAACKWFQDNLTTAAGAEARAYFAARDIDDTTIARFRLGFAPDRRDGIRVALMGQGISEDQLLEAGLISRPDDGRPTYDRFRGRVIFPITDRRGRVVAFGGRLLADREGVAKYLNSPETPLFSKGRLLYALDKAAAIRGAAGRDEAEIVVTEGYTDVIALHRAGFPGAVAPLGTALTEAQIGLLWRLAPEPVLCFDGDAAGRRAAARAAERALPLLKPGYSLRFALLPAGEDPDSLIRGLGVEAMRRILAGARPLVDLIWAAETDGRDFSTPERRADLWKSLQDRVLQISDRQIQIEYSVELRDRYFEKFREIRERKYKKSIEPVQLISKVAIEILDSRVPQVILLTIFNHLGLLNDFDETLSSLKLPPSDADDLKRDFLAYHAQCVATSENVTKDRLSNYVKSKKSYEYFEKMLRDERNIYIHGEFAKSYYSDNLAQLGLSHLMSAYFEKSDLEHQISIVNMEIAEARKQGVNEGPYQQKVALLVKLLEKKELFKDFDDNAYENYQELLKEERLVRKRYNKTQTQTS